ncbi:hypothetical protein IID22_00925, partial [Patescibacteria group bacterium]|nr:hypothetical protein [Patescibacteria group bacterium]
MINNKKAAMEMSVGTIVTIVLLMTVLIMGLVLVRTIFKSSIENINVIDESVKSEITKLFSEDNNKKLVIYPARKQISLKKGESGGFGFSIRNVEQTTGSFSYEVSVIEVTANCQMTTEAAENLIILGRSGSNIVISSGSILDAILVRYKIPESASLCNI